MEKKNIGRNRQYKLNSYWEANTIIRNKYEDKVLSGFLNWCYNQCKVKNEFKQHMLLQNNALIQPTFKTKREDNGVHDLNLSVVFRT